jgi:Leucine-rich repeat (LRR) protein
MKNLKRLDLSSNCLTQLPPKIGQLKSLEYLSISKNPIKALPEELKNLKEIKEICISEDLPDALKKQLIEWFGKNKIQFVIDEPCFLERPDFIERLNAF